MLLRIPDIHNDTISKNILGLSGLRKNIKASQNTYYLLVILSILITQKMFYLQ